MSRQGKTIDQENLHLWWGEPYGMMITNPESSGDVTEKVAKRVQELIGSRYGCTILLWSDGMVLHRDANTGEISFLGIVEVARFLPSWVNEFLIEPASGEYPSEGAKWGTPEEVAAFEERLLAELLAKRSK